MKFGWEPLSRVFSEPNFGDLVLAHWEEAGALKDALPFELDTQRMLDMAGCGLYRVWAARDEQTLVGYVGFSLVPSLHHKGARMAYGEAIMLAPAYRQGSAGYTLLSSAFDALRESGVRVVVCHAPDRLKRLFDRLECESLGEVRAKVL